MLKSEMTCERCIYGEPCGSFGSVKCIHDPESVMKRPEEHCGQGEWWSPGKGNYSESVFWGGWEDGPCYASSSGLSQPMEGNTQST